MEKIDLPVDLDGVFSALSHKHRREIIYQLGLQQCSIAKLATLRELSLPAIHKHIKILERAGMITRKKVGRSNFLTLNRDSLRGLQEWALQFHTRWGGDSDVTAAGHEVPGIRSSINSPRSFIE